MSVLFRIAVPADDATDPHAVITARQLAGFRRFLRAEGERIGVDLMEPDEYLGDSFEVRVCPLALAAVTGQFDHDPAIITVVEEAQFRGRRIAIHHSAGDAEIRMRVALTSDCGLELDLAYGNAYALLEALDIEAESVGDIALATLRERLADPATPARAAERRVEHYLPRLERLVASASVSDEARLVWA
ncbi:hypothetical protein EBBID32_13100 [Sphingobium indicum BiD32]|uniref:Uncharacterized protein n=1 Tax=Sphingobium indicum BiD32 TaxID=1301087 RepID=N1MJ26_9SPHN|nr:hypothetical protein [Sphingobium indicum]CCW16971.1 hypothetical protein EBBID32_13100 [Sphingobium indicum BiD32]